MLALFLLIRHSSFVIHMMSEKGKVLIIGDEESLSAESRQALELGQRAPANRHWRECSTNHLMLL
jgi:hypothetical protein